MLSGVGSCGVHSVAPRTPSVNGSVTQITNVICTAARDCGKRRWIAGGFSLSGSRNSIKREGDVAEDLGSRLNNNSKYDRDRDSMESP